MTAHRNKLPVTESFVITVRAKPRSSVSALEPEGPGTWVARLRSSPVDGKANAELVALVVKHFAAPVPALRSSPAPQRA